MTYEEIKAVVEQWPVAERLRLVEEISHSVRETLKPDGTGGANEAWREEFEAERARGSSRTSHRSPRPIDCSVFSERANMPRPMKRFGEITPTTSFENTRDEGAP
jgi:hypothetical protein